MADLLRRGAAFLARKLAPACPVLYTPKAGGPPLLLAAWPGSSRADGETRPKPAARVDHAERDYLFAAGDLIVGGVPVVPQRGDRVTEVVRGVETAWEAWSTGTEPCWRYADHTREFVRVHTKKAASA